MAIRWPHERSGGLSVLGARPCSLSSPSQGLDSHCSRPALIRCSSVTLDPTAGRSPNWEPLLLPGHLSSSPRPWSLPKLCCRQPCAHPSPSPTQTLTQWSNFPALDLLVTMDSSGKLDSWLPQVTATRNMLLSAWALWDWDPSRGHRPTCFASPSLLATLSLRSSLSPMADSLEEGSVPLP